MAKHLSLVSVTNALADRRDGKMLDDFLTPVLANIVEMTNTLSCRALNTPGLTIGTSSVKKIKIANNTLVCVNGTMALVAAAEVTLTTANNIADGYINAIVLVADSAGAVTTLMGTPALIAGGIAAVVLPEIPAARAVLGIATISTAAAAFVGGTTDLNAATVTDLYYDCVGPFNPYASTTA